MKALLAFIVALGVGPVCAEVRLPKLLASGMVLQRDATITLWGWADAGERARISFDGEQIEVRADRKGRWLGALRARPAGGPYEMTVTGKNTIVLHDILVGEVWLASGQSNMEWAIQSASGMSIDYADREVAGARFPQIRLFPIANELALTPQSDVSSTGWRSALPESVGEFSAVAYLFGRELHERYRVPVGLIQSSWSGTPAEAWIGEEGLRRFPEFLATARMLARMQAHAGTLVPTLLPFAPTVIFNHMIHPLSRFRIRGVIWYQGESNASDSARAIQYRTLFPALIENWRRTWGYEFPFLFVQLEGFGPNQPDPAEYPWAQLREAQDMALSLPRTGMATAVDIGNEADTHPKNKQDVAHRLVLAAAKVAYGEDVVHSGPRYQSMQVQGCCIRISFSDLGSGLRIKDKYGDVKGFEIAAADGKFVWAQARTVGDEIEVCNDSIYQPAAVRYDWSNTPDGNVYNREGLPALPFRTDTGLVSPKFFP